MYLVLLSLALTASAPDLNGKWEVQTMGADRELTVQQKGPKILAHRVMWPEFEGEKYKLEHLYRGTINGNTIKGDLLVKEDELPKFEVLRSFTGTMSADGSVVLDGMPLKRLGAPVAGATPPPADDSGQRPSEPPTLSKKEDGKRPSDAPLAQAAPTPPPSAPAAAPASDDPGASLFANIMGSAGSDNLFHVSASITMPNEAQSLGDEGDALFKKKKAQEALAKYEAAKEVEGGSDVGLLHRIGRCHLALKHYAEARDVLKRALKLDPSNTAVKKDYQKAKAKA